MSQATIPPQVSLRAVRQALGLDSRQLAERIRAQDVEVHPDHILNVELGYKRANRELMVAWARALGIESHLQIKQADDLLVWLTAKSEDMSEGVAA